MMVRWLTVLSAFVIGIATAVAVVSLAILLLAAGLGPSQRGPQRWTPVTPTPTPVATPTPPLVGPTPTPEGIYVGGTARVVSNVGVRLRRSPGYQNKPASDVLTVVPPHSVVAVVGGPEEADGLRWWRVRWRSYEGWMAEATASGVQLLAPGGE